MVKASDFHWYAQNVCVLIFARDNLVVEFPYLPNKEKTMCAFYVHISTKNILQASCIAFQQMLKCHFYARLN